MSDFKPNIWQLQAQFNTQGLVNALSDEDPGIRRRAAAALRALGAVNAIDNLRNALESESDPETRAAMVASLEALEQEQIRREQGGTETGEHPVISSEVERLISKLENPDPQVIIEAAHGLGNLGDKIAVPALMVIFTDSKTQIKVRLAVAEALLKLESAPVEVTLLGALRNPEWRVRRNGAAILGQLQADWAIEPLARAILDDNEVVRKTAYAALKHIGTPEAKAAIKAARNEIAKRKAQGPASNNQEQETPENDETQKIIWPSRRKKDDEEEENTAETFATMAPTKPFDPEAIERAREQVERMRREQAQKQQDQDQDDK